MSPFTTNLDIYNGQTQDLVQELLIEAQAEIISHRFDKAVELLEQAVERGSANAAANLGTFYINGELGKVTRDYLRGFQWYLRALTLSAKATPVDCTADLLDIVQTFTDLFKFHWIEHDRNPVEWKEGHEMLRSLAKKLERESHPVIRDSALQIEEDYRRAIRITLLFSRGFMNEDVSRNDKAASCYRKCISIPPSTLEEALSLQQTALFKIQQIVHTPTAQISDAFVTTPVTDMPANRSVCANCKKEGETLPVCSKCKVVKYCNSKCLGEHNKVHQLVCMPKPNSK